MGPHRPVDPAVPGRFLRSCRENGETRTAGGNSPAFLCDSAAARIARLTTGLISCVPGILSAMAIFRQVSEIPVRN